MDPKKHLFPYVYTPYFVLNTVFPENSSPRNIRVRLYPSHAPIAPRNGYRGYPELRAPSRDLSRNRHSLLNYTTLLSVVGNMQHLE